MFSWFNYWHYDELIRIIDLVSEDRKKRRLNGKTMKSKFAEDLKDYLNGVWVEEQEENLVKPKEEKKQEKEEEMDENIKMYIENQFGKD